jgi:oligopeptide/dipeptide ABC transporter ATP-binding protein
LAQSRTPDYRRGISGGCCRVGRVQEFYNLIDNGSKIGDAGLHLVTGTNVNAEPSVSYDLKFVLLILEVRVCSLVAENPQSIKITSPFFLFRIVQIQILLLLRELQRELGMAVIFVTHDIGVAVEICDRVAVMYAGRIVESGALREVVKHPAHPYTRRLLAATVLGARRGARLETIPGAPPRLDRLAPGCAFAPRCPIVAPACAEGDIAAVTLAPGRTARCIKLRRDTKPKI